MMGMYLLAVYLHVVATVFWFGYLLFWVILIKPLIRQYEGRELEQILGQLNKKIWPPVLVPKRYCLRLSGLGWTTLVMLFITGFCILYGRGGPLQSLILSIFFLNKDGQVLVAKLVLSVGIGIGHLLMTYRPTPRLIYLELMMTVSIIGLSVLLVR